MAQLIWSDSLLPSVEPVVTLNFAEFKEPLRVENTQAIAIQENDFLEIPDRKALRLMSRSSVLMSALMMRAKSFVTDLLAADPFRVATYCAIDNGAESYSCVEGLLEIAPNEFAEKYRRLRSPKQYLKQLPNLAPAQMGIFLGLVGPLNVFHHSHYAGHHALDQMQADFKSGLVDFGIVVSANSFEDPLLTYRNRQDAGDKVLREGAGAAIFSANGGREQRLSALEFESAYDYGIASHTIELSTQGAGK